MADYNPLRDVGDSRQNPYHVPKTYWGSVAQQQMVTDQWHRTSRSSPASPKRVITIEEYASGLCSREKKIIERERSALERMQRKVRTPDLQRRINEQTLVLAAREERYNFARSQVSAEARKVNETFRTSVWRGVQLPVGAQYSDGYKVFFGSIFAFAVLYGLIGITWVLAGSRGLGDAHADWYGFVMLAGIILIPFYLSRHLPLARKLTKILLWLVVLGFVAYFLRDALREHR